MITHRVTIEQTWRGNLTRKEELPKMGTNAQEELKAHLMATNEDFRRLAVEHSEYAQKIESLEAQPHLSEHDRIEENRLKKLKLRLKDQMELFMSRYRAQNVA